MKGFIKFLVFAALLILLAIELSSPETTLSQVATDKLAENTMAQIDKVRAENGLPALTWDDTLNAQAKSHSYWMAEKSRFIHSSYNVFENIYEGYPSGYFCVDAWMHSPGHKANLLDPTITRAGIGVSFGITLSVYFTFQAI